MLEPMLRRLANDHRLLLEGTEDNHARRVLLAPGRLLFEEPTAKGEEVGNVEMEIGVERCLVCLIALTVLNPAAFPP